MPTGKVRWFNSRKGYGFIRPDDDRSEDVVVHHADVIASSLQSLSFAQPISYELVTEDGNTRAANLKLYSGQPVGREL